MKTHFVLQERKRLLMEKWIIMEFNTIKWDYSGHKVKIGRLKNGSTLAASQKRRGNMF